MHFDADSHTDVHLIKTFDREPMFIFLLSTTSWCSATLAYHPYHYSCGGTSWRRRTEPNWSTFRFSLYAFLDVLTFLTRIVLAYYKKNKPLVICFFFLYCFPYNYYIFVVSLVVKNYNKQLNLHLFMTFLICAYLNAVETFSGRAIPTDFCASFLLKYQPNYFSINLF